MKPWDIFTWDFPGAREHPAVILGTVEAISLKTKVAVLLCTSQRVNRGPKPHEVILDQADGLDWQTLCKCDLPFAVHKDQLKHKRGSVSSERRRQITKALIQQLGLAGL